MRPIQTSHLFLPRLISPSADLYPNSPCNFRPRLRTTLGWLRTREGIAFPILPHRFVFSSQSHQPRAKTITAVLRQSFAKKSSSLTSEKYHRDKSPTSAMHKCWPLTTSQPLSATIKPQSPSATSVVKLGSSVSSRTRCTQS